ncbi:MAG: heme ABC transporter ATP-binding protein [Sinobacteraceae bacterium]|nr:heme ABC transporter ATP-binding protein [Nevskiaceae bacterium]
MTGLVADGVSIQRRERSILQGVNLSVQAGQLVALIGPNGAGKSTLLRALAGELRPRQGSCAIDGLDVFRTSAATLARRRAVLPQDAGTDFPLIAEDVVMLGRAPWRRHAPPARNRRAVREAVAATGAGPLLHRDYRSLSGGERQRIQLARVLAQIWDVHWDGTPRYLLLDEPTASLDIGHQQRLLTMVRQVLSRGIGVLAVLHDLNLAAAFADRIYLLQRGCVVAHGTAPDVLQANLLNTVYSATLDVHAHARTHRPIVLVHVDNPCCASSAAFV